MRMRVAAYNLLALLSAQSVLLVVPLVVFAAALLLLLAHRQEREAEHELQQSARTLAVAVDREISGSIRQLERLADFPTLNEPTLGEFHAYAREVVGKREEWDNLVLFDREGRQRFNAEVDFGRDLPVVDRPHNRQVFTRGMPAISDVYENSRSGARVIAVAVPVVRDGEVRWALTARLNERKLSELLAEQQIRAGGLASVVDREMRIVARSKDIEKNFGAPSNPHYASLVRSAPSGVARSTTIEGAPFLVAWERLAIGWTVGVGVPLGALSPPVTQSITALALVGLALLALAIWGSTVLTRRVAGEVDLAGRLARRLAHGEPVPAHRSTVRQFGALFDALHESGERLTASLAAEREARAAAEAAQKERLAAITRDNTERRAAEEALRLADRRKDEFLAMLAHELRNPLAPIASCVEILKRVREPDPTVTWAREVIGRQTEQLGRLVDDLLDVSRVTEGKITLRVEPVALASIVERAVETSRPLVEKRRHRVELVSDPRPVVVDGDAVRLAQAVANLVDNAAKYTPDAGVIRIRTRYEDGQASIAVEDSGVGIAGDVLPHVFDLFHQAETSLDRSHGGLGIGLTLVKKLIEMHDGKVVAESDGPGKGATFTIRLPARLDRDEAVSATASIPLPARVAPEGRKRVLVVDDNRDGAESIAAIVQFAGHETRIAEDGPQALREAEAFAPHIVLCDLGLPGMDGYRVAEALRASPRGREMMLVAVTGYGQPGDRERSARAGFDRHLVKPVDLEELEGVVGKVAG